MPRTPELSSLRRALVADLVSRACIRSPEWRDAFERVPRHVFVPRFYDWSLGDALPAEPIVVADDPERWLPRVYSDVVLPTEIGRETGRWVSSSSKPSMMAAFLEALDVRDGDSVLEIGTGTGYNAALLCERLGSGRVTTVDIRAQLIADARARLTECGYEPTIAVADGVEGYPPCAPYDRIVATCSVHRIPDPWIDQLAPEGVIVTPLRGGRFTEGLAVLRKDPGDTLQGRLRPERVWFVPLEGQEDAPEPDALAHRLEAVVTPGSGVARPCIVPPWLEPDAEDVFDPAFLLRVQLPDAEWLRRGESELVIASAQDRSWAKVTIHPDGPVVEQGGDRNLWDLVESSYRLWLHLRPRLSRYGITITADRRQHLWLDDPESEHRWELSGRA